MLYIVIALKPEAQAFVDKYKLSKMKLSGLNVFYNTTMMLIISGLGIDKAAIATQTLINHYDITDDDVYLNVGICGAHNSHPLSSVLEIGTLHYKEQTYQIQSKSKHTLTCLEEEVSEPNYTIVDMESFGFYDAVIHSPAIKKYYIIKVVSDHFAPETITKDNTKSLVFNAIDAINVLINYQDKQ